MTDQEKERGTCWLNEIGHGGLHEKSDRCSEWREQPAQGEPPPLTNPVVRKAYESGVDTGFKVGQMNPDQIKWWFDEREADVLAQQIWWSGFCEKHLPNKSQQYNACWRCSREEESRTVGELREELAALKAENVKLSEERQFLLNNAKRMSEIVRNLGIIPVNKAKLSNPIEWVNSRAERAESALAEANREIADLKAHVAKLLSGGGVRR